MMNLPPISHNLLDEGPEAPPQIDGLFEQDKTLEQMEATIRRAMREIYDGKTPSRIFALFGRYGQGKTRIIKKLQGAFPGARIFRVADHDEKDLLRNFDHFMVRGKFSILVIFLLSVISILYLAPLLIGYFTDINNNPKIDAIYARILILIISIVIAVLMSLVSPVRLWWRDVMRTIRMEGAAGILSSIKQWFRGIWGWFTIASIQKWPWPPMPPRSPLLVIDDLDRASPEQQKAILLALRRYRSKMFKVVVVAFDETPLLKTDMQDEQSAEELLVKTFDASFRLAPLNVQDAAEMAWHFLKEIGEQNPGCPWAKRLRHPMIVGDMARAFILHGSASARFARRMVNMLYLQVLHIQPRNMHDISTLIRILGLFQYLPALENDADIIARRFNDLDEDGLIDAIEKRIAGKLGDVRKYALRHYLAATRHMRPVDGGWGVLLHVKWRNLSSRSQSDKCFPNEADLSKLEKSSLLWALWEALMASQNKYQGRLVLYQKLLDGAVGDYISPPEDEEIINYSYHEINIKTALWKALSLRLLLHDEKIICKMNPIMLGKYIVEYEACQKDPLVRSCAFPALLFHYEKDGKRAFWAGAHEFILHQRRMRAYSNSDEGNIFHDLLRITLVHALSGKPPDVAIQRNFSETEKLSSPGQLPISIQNGWPLFHGPCTRDVDNLPKMHFHELGRITNQFPRDMDLLPKAHKSWLKERKACNDYTSITNACNSYMSSAYGGMNNATGKAMKDVIDQA